MKKTEKTTSKFQKQLLELESDDWPERTLENIKDACEKLRGLIDISVFDENRERLKSILRVLENDLFREGKEIELSQEDVANCLDFWPNVFDGLKVHIC